MPGESPYCSYRAYISSNNLVLWPWELSQGHQTLYAAERLSQDTKRRDQASLLGSLMRVSCTYHQKLQAWRDAFLSKVATVLTRPRGRNLGLQIQEEGEGAERKEEEEKREAEEEEERKQKNYWVLSLTTTGFVFQTWLSYIISLMSGGTRYDKGTEVSERSPAHCFFRIFI